MDRTNAIARLNTEEIVNEVNNVIKNGLAKLLGDHLYRYELLERTHEALMNLPSIRNELNQNPYDFVKEHNTRHRDKNDCDMIKNDCDMIKYDLLIEKLTKRIDELTYEINTLKYTMSVKDGERIKEEPIKEEQRENIKLVIDTSFNEDDINNDIENIKAQIKKVNGFASSVASSVASLEADEEEVAEEEEVADEEEEEVADEEEEEVADEEEEEVADEEEDEVADEEEDEEEASLEADDEASEAVETENSDSEEEVADVNEVAETVASLPVASLPVASLPVASLEEEFIEIDIDDITYCTNNEENGFIYELTEDGDVGDKVGYLKDGEPFFYADEK